jgi:hypothetical protein
VFTKLLRPGVLGAGLLLLTLSAPALAQNVLVNPGFEDGSTGQGASGWMTFGNVYTEAANPPQFVPFEGARLASIFGPFSGPFGVSGMYQEFPTTPGTQWQLSCKVLHYSGDALTGSEATGGNWVVQKIVFKDAEDAELPGAVEATILDGAYDADVWHEPPAINGTAPTGTAQVEAFILYVQPAADGGAAHVDNVDFRIAGSVPVDPATWGRIKALYGN